MSDLVDLSLRQFAGAWRLMCADGSRYVSETADGAEYVFSGVPIAFFNVALLTARDVTNDALAGHAGHARAWAAAHGVPWMFVVTHERLAQGTDAASVMERSGFGEVMMLTGMRADRVGPAARVHERLVLTVPKDDQECRALVDVNALAYGMELEAGMPLIGRRAFWTGHFPVVGLNDGTPACCAAVLMVDGHRYVALVATDPAQQRRGYADAAMRRALELAAETHGERPTVLHATAAGKPVYERMGYGDISTHTLYMDKAFLGH